MRSTKSLLLTIGLSLGAASGGGCELPEESATAAPDVVTGAPDFYVRRDARGTPYVRGTTEASTYRGICYAMAEDRLFQMDVLRRSGQGRLAEIFGAGADDAIVRQDLLMRAEGVAQIGAAKLAAATARTRDILTACASGVNLYISRATTANTLPPEFAILGYAPERWQAADSLTIIAYVSTSLSAATWQSKLQYGAIATLVSPEAAAALLPFAPESPSIFSKTGALNPPLTVASLATPTPAATHPAVTPLPLFDGAARALGRLPGKSIGLGEMGNRMSNAFAVDGALSSTGKPLLASDPHLGLSVPTMAYLIHVASPHGRLEGVTLPGLPIFISGHTRSHAWGVTLALLDDVDLYSEELRPGAYGEEVRYNGTWVPVTTRTETVQVAGQDPVSIVVKSTPHGPLLGSALPELEAFGPLALKTALAQPAWNIDGFFLIPQAATWSTFLAAARSVGLGLNWHFSDTTGARGRIGYAVGGVAPQRDLENTVAPVPGGDGDHEWRGYATGSQLPSVYNPASHMLVTANNRIVPSDYAPGGVPVYLSNYYDMPWRSQRIGKRLISGAKPLTAAAIGSIQLDKQSVVGAQLRDAYVAALSQIGLPAGDPSAAASLAALRTWDGNVDASSRGAAVYETLTAVLIKNMAVGVIGADLYAGYAPSVFYATQVLALQRLLADPRAPFFGATGPADAVAARNRAVRAALAEADALMRKAMSANVATWSWGKIHTLGYNHPLAELIPDFDIGRFPAHGDVSTVWLGGWFLGTGLLALPADALQAAGGLKAAMAQDAWSIARVVWNLGALDRSLGVLATGASGVPGPHFADQAPRWRAGGFFTLAFTAAAVNANTN